MTRSPANIPAAVAAVALVLSAAGCSLVPGSGVERSSGDVATETREVAEFTAIRAPGPVDVVATIGDETSVSVEADDNLIELVTTEVVDGALVVDVSRSLNTRGPLTVTVTAPIIDEVVADGAGDIRLDAGNLGDRLRIEATGAGDVVARGEVAELDVEADGAGDVDAEALSAMTATVTAEGVGDVAVGQTETLDVTADGVGDVRYSGSPELSVRNDGLGDVEQAD